MYADSCRMRRNPKKFVEKAVLKVSNAGVVQCAGTRHQTAETDRMEKCSEFCD